MAEKLDVIDFIITALREHERNLDRAVNQLCELLSDMRRSQSQSHQPSSSRSSISDSRGVSGGDRSASGRTSSSSGEAEGRELNAESSEEKAALQQILNLLNQHRFLSLTDVSRMTFDLGTRNWLAGFMAALEATGVVERRGTATHKLHVLTPRGRRLLEEMKLG